MKKVLIAALAAALLLGATACGGSDKQDEKPAKQETQVEEVEETPEENTEESSEENPTQGIADEIKSLVTVNDAMAQISTQRNAANAYPTLTEFAEEFTIYIDASGATPEEITVFQVEEGKMEEAKAAIDERIEFQKDAFVNYQPAQMPKLEDPVVVVNEETGRIAYVVAEDGPAAAAAIEEALK